MTRFRLLLLACAAVLVCAVPAASSAADRMLVGFQDDPSLRWLGTRDANLDAAAATHASIIRTTVYWARVAPTRPSNAADPFAKQYRFDDLDEFVRNATLRGMTVMLSIWGTPPWANGGKGQNYAPTRMSDLQNFAHALAARYSGRYPGYPFVGYYSVWNEPNLSQFLAPAYDSKGKPSSPFVYARMARAAYAGIKSGNARALVAIGETSPRGRLKPSPKPGKLQDTIAPGLFAQLVSQARPRVRFDAWAHHPYSSLGEPPTQRVRFPNVDLVQLPTFQRKLDTWFRRKGTPIWITEYGFETKPGEPKGVTQAQQATYARQSLLLAEKDPYVQMFIWFIFRDEPVSTWQSGLLREDATRKPAFAAFSALAKVLDVRDPAQHIPPGSSNPTVRVPVWELLVRDGVGARVGATVSVTFRGKSIGVSQPSARIGIDGYVAFRVPLTKAQKNGLYLVFLNINDANGNAVTRTVTLVSN